ncbi:MAG: site-specific DNA-methyltransferase [Lachnospiraceae bacterium]|nr:site-specific DNA-methyltransferase [Lachnospiraceae bacterium]
MQSYILYNGDCLEYMKKIKSSSVDLIVTDPPYNLGKFMENRDTNLGKMRDIAVAEKNGFYYKTTGIWHKLNPMPRNMNLHFVNSTETWIYFTYKSRTGTFNNDGKVLHDFVETSVTPNSERKYGKHPTQKPEQLMEHFVSILSNEKNVVLDPFMGSGSVGVAAVRLKRKFIGIELEENYYNIANSRIMEVNACEEQ